MNAFRKNALIVALLSAGLTLAGCGEEKTGNTAKPAAQPLSTSSEAPKAKADAVDGKVLATVNGQPISQIDIDVIAAQLPQRPNEVKLVEQIADLRLLAQTARDQGLDKDPKVKALLRHAEDNQLANELLQNFVEGISIAEDKLKAEYDKLVAQMPKEEQLHASHILVESEDEAKKLIEQIKNGADFSALAKEHSKDPGSGQQGGDLGWFTAKEMVPEFSEGVLALEPGKVGETPVKSQFGWHVIRLEGKRQTPPPAMDAVRPQLENRLKRTEVDAYIKGLRDKAKIEILIKPEAAPAPAIPAAAPEAPAGEQK